MSKRKFQHINGKKKKKVLFLRLCVEIFFPSDFEKNRKIIIQNSLKINERYDKEKLRIHEPPVEVKF